jgi:hypothetical protein
MLAQKHILQSSHYADYPIILLLPQALVQITTAAWSQNFFKKPHCRRCTQIYIHSYPASEKIKSYNFVIKLPLWLDYVKDTEILGVL